MIDFTLSTKPFRQNEGFVNFIIIDNKAKVKKIYSFELIIRITCVLSQICLQVLQSTVDQVKPRRKIKRKCFLYDTYTLLQCL